MDLEDFKSFCRVLKPSGVGSIPTHSRQIFSQDRADRRDLCVLTMIPPRRRNATPKSGMPARVKIAIIVIGALLYPCTARCGSCVTGEYLPNGSGLSQAVVPDTIRGDEEGNIWTKEGLKEILVEQSGLGPEGEALPRKNARLAMLCTLLFPGLGQMYNERPFKAIIAMGVESFYLSRILLNHRYSQRAERLRDSLPVGSTEWSRQDWWVDEYKERRLDWIWWSSGVLVILLIDAYVDAHLYDMNVSVEGVSLEGGGGIGFVFTF